MGGGFAARGGMQGGMRPSFAHGMRPSFAHGMRSSFAHGGHSGFHGHPPRHGSFVVHHHGFHTRGFARFASYPYYTPYYGWYGGLWDWDSSSYDSRDDYQRYVAQTSDEMNRLANEVQQLREERDYAQYAQPAPPPAPQPTAQAAMQESLPVVVVFLDKHIQEVKNYAVANEMLVVLDGNRRTKFPLADIDLAATMKLNDERGVNFDIPNPVMNQ
jgi:hypothetical protein